MSVRAHRREVLLRESALNVAVIAAGALVLRLGQGRSPAPRRVLGLLGGFVLFTGLRAAGISLSDYLWKLGHEGPVSAPPP